MKALFEASPWLVPILILVVSLAVSVALVITCRPEKETAPKGQVLMPKPLTVLTAYHCHRCGTVWGPDKNDLEPGEVIHHHFFNKCEQHAGELP